MERIVLIRSASEACKAVSPATDANGPKPNELGVWLETNRTSGANGEDDNVNRAS